MPKIKYVLFKYENIVIFKILSMDERFRAKGTANVFKSAAIKDFRVISGCCRTRMYNNYIYLLGQDKTLDNSCSSATFKTEQEAEDYMQTVRAALIDWAANWDGFKKKERKQEYVGIQTKIPICQIW